MLGPVLGAILARFGPGSVLALGAALLCPGARVTGADEERTSRRYVRRGIDSGALTHFSHALGGLRGWGRKATVDPGDVDRWSFVAVLLYQQVAAKEEDTPAIRRSPIEVVVASALTTGDELNAAAIASAATHSLNQPLINVDLAVGIAGREAFGALEKDNIAAGRDVVDPRDGADRWNRAEQRRVARLQSSIGRRRNSGRITGNTAQLAFIRVVAIDLRTPLVVVIGQAGARLEDEDPTIGTRARRIVGDADEPRLVGSNGIAGPQTQPADRPIGPAFRGLFPGHVRFLYRGDELDRRASLPPIEILGRRDCFVTLAVCFGASEHKG